MPDWESPLRPGDTVECHGGLSFCVIELQKSADFAWSHHYWIRCRIVSPGPSGYEADEIQWLTHTRRDRLVVTLLESINGVPIHQFLPTELGLTLEEEFFERTSNA